MENEKIEEKPEIKKRGRPKGSKKEKVIDKSNTKKGNLNLEFIPDLGDDNPPKIEDSQQGGSENKPLIQIDYEATARGFLQMIDMIFGFIAMVSRGQIEYQKLSENEFKAGTNALVMEKKVLEVIASQSWAIHAIVMMQLVGVFAPRIKLKKKKKTEKIEEVPKQSASEIKKEQVHVKLSKEQIENIEKKSETNINDSEIFLDDTMNIIINENASIENLDGSSGELPIISTEKRDKDYGEPKEGKGTKLVKKENKK